ncbi:uncharacterized protein LOC110861563 [Folsomia candida]|uniref:uncharacterized protein LOC110861563 n=1 Tax=Folsomia candida TaxID=158441 RepID=UPI0016052E98|nr:uncharacterized protein LOC110861563 [Folsomia candida]
MVMSHCYWLMLVHLLLILHSATPMHISYCGSDGSLITLGHNSCSGGFNFGPHKLSCVCISGIYRLWMDNCVVYDGFMDGGCSSLIVAAGEAADTVGVVSRLRFASGLESEEQEWVNSTTAVFSASASRDYESWQAWEVGSRASTTADNFYTTHGDAFLLTSTPPRICVERKLKDWDEICRYFREENNQLWGPGGIEVQVEENCAAPFGAKKIPLRSGSCYNIMRQQDSECTLSCGGSGGGGGGESSTYPTPPISTSTEKVTEENKLLQRRSPSSKKSDNDKGRGDINKSANKSVSTSSEQNPFKATTAHQQTQQTNFWLNRKLNHYSKLRQVGYLKAHDLTQIPPTRTFELLELIREIGKRVCGGDQYVSSLYIDQALDLFVLLHKGRNYRYTEDLGGSEAGWIRTILGGCLLDARPLSLVMGDTAPPGCTDLQKVTGVCADGLNNCTQLRVSKRHGFEDGDGLSNGGVSSTIGTYHLVVETAWDLVDLAQVVCFPAFAQSYRMLHQWEQATEKLFTREIRKLWHNPGLSMKAYQSLLTPSAGVDAHNLEMCVEGAYALNPSLSRLVRPPEPRRFFKRRKRDTEQVAADVYCRATEPDFEYPC